ncbi:hypothetical protein FNV43_RR21005 [Rhamnella rubrinervis]|uniref:Helicase C-terminal domain-containing protein n=1 Tax=Rhamnella rubrinervis TaxID=2594499 RepID=A0A8K0E289_9ROSA|nr:hypothetical protein FNV43_RR21005 [Rhamnella rubrinervis]
MLTLPVHAYAHISSRLIHQELPNLPKMELIQNEGSPSARKLVILWNPILRQETEVCNQLNSNFYGCDRLAILEETAHNPIDSICAYCAGYIAEDRRSIERDFFGRKLCGIAATNALELGIDVTLYLGFPDNIASLWQQAGRAGRRERPSLAVYVAFDDPRDQHFMTYPRKHFGGPIERCHIDAQKKQLYDGAVYICQGRTYLVQSLDLSSKIAFCVEADLKYYTRLQDCTDIHIISSDIAYPTRVGTAAKADPCKAVWVPVPQSTKLAVAINNLDFRAGLHAASHAVLNVVPLYNFGCHEYTEVLHKDAAIMFIKGVLDAEQGSEGPMAE